MSATNRWAAESRRLVVLPEDTPCWAAGTATRRADGDDQVRARDLSRRGGPTKDRLSPRSACPILSATPPRSPIGESAVAFLSGLLAGGRVERRTRRAAARWAATAMRCWCCAGSSTAPESPSSRSTTSSACPRPTAICPRRSMSSPPRHPSLHGALLAARIAGHTHVHLDGTLIRTDRSKASGTTCGRRGTSAAASSTAAHEERDVLGGGVVRCGGCGGSRARSVGARPAAGAVSGGRG